MANVRIGGNYDHPNFTIPRQAALCAVQAPSTSLTAFAHFRSRNKCLVTHCTITCTSLPSAATAWSMYVMRGASTVASKTISSMSINGVAELSAVVFTIAAEGTLNSIGNFMNLQMDTTEKGKFDVIWEYRFLHA